MKTRRTPLRTVLGLLLLLGGVGRGAAATANDAFLADLNRDYDVLASYLNGELARTFGFYATLGWPTGPKVLDAVKGPRAQVGIGAGVDLVKVDLDAVSLEALAAESNIDFPSTLPLPFPVWHGKIGLLRGLDFGLRATGYPRIQKDDFSTANRGLGFEVRLQALHGPTVPDVSVNLSWDRMQGDVYIYTEVDQQSPYEDGGSSYTATVTGDSVYMNAWDVRSFGLKVMVGRSLGLFHPFGALGIQRHAGRVDSRLTAEVDETLRDSGGVVVGTPTHVSLDLRRSAEPPVTQPKFILGFELGTGFRWSNLFETNGVDKAFATGFRLEL
jgi:hypothetical protein